MTRHFRLEAVLLSQGWTRDVMLSVAPDGRISAVSPYAEHSMLQDTSQPFESVRGFVVPGMPNAHSHAFQRGMVGSAESRLSAQDSFWTWRNAMYALANRVTPDELQILATQLFIEMLKSGYTSVAEFHYLHRQPDGNLYPPGAGLWEAVSMAATSAGIGLTLLPTLYQNSDFGGRPLRRDQLRFALDTEWFIRELAERIGAEKSARCATMRTGAAFHSLRAVSLSTIETTSSVLRQIDSTLPLHIHVAEQTQEVQSCRQMTGQRPIELLVGSGLLDAHWCLIHATHATPRELSDVAASGAAVCVSISTEANLGDGFFAAARFMKAGGRVCIGSDSQATVCPAEELRWLEYQQRLKKRRRVVLADLNEAHVGTRLWRDAACDGAHAIGQPAGAIEVGRRADLLVLDAEHPVMAGASVETALDHLVFAGGRDAIRDVMVAGHWVVKDGCHGAEMPLRRRFLQLMNRLA